MMEVAEHSREKVPEAEANADIHTTEDTMYDTKADITTDVADRVGPSLDAIRPSGDEKTSAELWSAIVDTARTDSAKAWEMLKKDFPALTPEAAVKLLVDTTTAVDLASTDSKTALADAFPVLQRGWWPQAGTSRTENESDAPTPSSIRVTLRKPMGIVFEPMTDANNNEKKRGVRICKILRSDPLSRRLEVGDQLLGVDDKDTTCLTYDETLDFIMKADQKGINLLFHRPNKDELKPTPRITGSSKDMSFSKDESKSNDESSFNDTEWVEYQDDYSESQASDQLKSYQKHESFLEMLVTQFDSLFVASDDLRNLNILSCNNSPCAPPPSNGRRSRSKPHQQTFLDDGSHHQAEAPFDSFLDKLEANKEMKRALLQVRAL